MLFDIDIVFISDGLVVDVVSNVEPGYLVTEQTPCDMFLEVNAGEAAGVVAGDAVTTEVIQPPGTDFSQAVAVAIPLVVLGFVCAAVGGLSSSMGNSKSTKKLTKGEAAYYWTAVNKATGEIVENHTSYTSSSRALKDGKSFVCRHWRGDKTLIEVWRQPHYYSQGLEIKPVAAKIVTGGPNPGNPGKSMTKEATVECPICKEVVKIPDYNRVTRSDALKRHIQEKHQSRHIYLSNPGRPTRHDVEIGTWVERERTAVWLTDKRSGKTVAEWWDEDAREMFDQGWFKPGDIRQQTITGRDFEESVLDYAESTGLLAGKSKGYKVRFIGACKVVDGLCHSHGYSVSKAVKCPDSELTQEEWAAAWELAYEAFPEGQHNPWVDGWWPKTLQEAEEVVRRYESKMEEAVANFRARQHKAIANYERAANKAVYNYRQYVMKEYERGKTRVAALIST
ncbi:MAG: DUF192 domain-containing protein, partial [Dehalococcoidales bacterium]|nr:DUF192 domain-containing protein [Dehalococcoidales bacterium]